MLEPSELFPEVPNLYEFPSVHADMLFDRERVGKYSEAIKKHIKPGSIVADLGTGTGLLAFLCLKAGAKRVHAIDRSSAINWAKQISSQNGFSEKINFYQKDSRDTKLPEKVDVIISELIGHIGFEEGMVESVFDAKNRFLKTGGSIIPQKVDLRIALASESKIYKECVDCWEPIEGLNFGVLKDAAIKSCYLTNIDDRDILSEPKTFFSVDFCQNEMPLLIGKEFFRACRSDRVNGIIIWFDAMLTDQISLSSSPWKSTHWKQCFAPIKRPISVVEGDILVVEIKMKLRELPSDKFNFELNISKKQSR